MYGGLFTTLGEHGATVLSSIRIPWPWPKLVSLLINRSTFLANLSLKVQYGTSTEVTHPQEADP